MAREPRLAALIGLSRDDIEAFIRDTVLEAAEIVAEEFRRILGQLQAESENGVFDGYEVVIDIEPYSVSYRSLGTIKTVKCHIYVKSPDPELNVFDILDTGRKGLPYRDGSQSPYPIWSDADSRAVSRPGERRRGYGGRFAISSPPSNLRGKRPEKLRYKLMGTREPGFQYSPARFSRGPIPAVPATNLYKRIYNIARKKLRAKGFSFYDLLLVERKKA